MAIGSHDHGTTNRVAGKVHESIDRLAAKAGHAEERLRHDAGTAQGRLRESGHHARERSEDLLSTACDYVRENPMTAIGLAFAAGTLVAWLRRRRR